MVLTLGFLQELKFLDERLPEACCLPGPILTTVLENSLPHVKERVDFNIHGMGFFEPLEIFIWEQGLKRIPST